MTALAEHISNDKVSDYLRRSGDKRLPDGTYVENENGFCVFEYMEDAMVLIAVYGDGAYWNKWAERRAKSRALSKLIFVTQRNPAGFIRKHGYHVIGHVLQRTL